MLDLRNQPDHPLYGDFTVSITETFSPGLDCAIHPIAVAVNESIAKSLHRHFSKENTWSDIHQTGSWCELISRTYCTNHESFEEENDPFEDIYDDEPLFA